MITNPDHYNAHPDSHPLNINDDPVQNTDHHEHSVEYSNNYRHINPDSPCDNPNNYDEHLKDAILTILLTRLNIMMTFKTIVVTILTILTILATIVTIPVIFLIIMLTILTCLGTILTILMTVLTIQVTILVMVLTILTIL